jgi:hypothetical protein
MLKKFKRDEPFILSQGSNHLPEAAIKTYAMNPTASTSNPSRPSGIGVKLSKGFSVKIKPQAWLAAWSQPWRTMRSSDMSTWGTAVNPVERAARRTWSCNQSSCGRYNRQGAAKRCSAQCRKRT